MAVCFDCCKSGYMLNRGLDGEERCIWCHTRVGLDGVPAGMRPRVVDTIGFQAGSDHFTRGCRTQIDDTGTLRMTILLWEPSSIAAVKARGWQTGEEA